MGRSVMLGNGHLLVGLNEKGMVHDFYYPYVGLENLTTARSVHHMIGVWVDGDFSWLDSDAWEIKVDFESDALVGSVLAKHRSHGISLEFTDFVDHQHDAFCRRIKAVNNSAEKRSVRLFLHQVFQISNEGRADTVLFVPGSQYLFDYKGRCSLLIYSRDSNGKPFDQFSVGNYGIEGKQGTFKDAEDGELTGNLVEHGGVDSVMRLSADIQPDESEIFEYWIIASFSQYDAEAVHNKFCEQGLATRLDYTRVRWQKWLEAAQDEVDKLDEKYKVPFKKSLMVVKAHIDKRGGIIASGDSSIYNYGRDYYSYVWPRDGALTMLPLIKAGYTEEPKRFFEFCLDTIHPNGFMMHKYQPDRSIGSTWHPLMHQAHPELAIQEDETATVLYALGEYYEKTGDKEFLDKVYEHLVEPAANFMAGFIDQQTNLPHASYDLWEERFATHSYTVFITQAALIKAAQLAKVMEHIEQAESWARAAAKIELGIKLLYDQERQCYRKSLLLLESGDLEFNNTVDSSSLYGAMSFYKNADEEVLQNVANAVTKFLKSPNPIGGVSRYEHDSYFLRDKDSIGNPWIICTLWLAQHMIRSGRTDEALAEIDWVLDRRTESGMLSEQVDPNTGFQVGVSPLVWSHAELVDTLILLGQTRR